MHIKTVNDITNLDNIQSLTSEHTSVLSYLLEFYPDGFDCPVTIFLADEELDVEDYERAIGIDETIVIIFHPGFVTLFGSAILAYVANFAIAAAISYAIGEIFKQDIPSQDLSSSIKSNGRSSSVYNLNSQQNIQRLGQPIPIIYGKIRVYPSLVENTYKKYIDNEEYIFQLMCIGIGKYNINNLLVADTESNDINIDTIKIVQLIESDFNNIPLSVGDDEYHQRVREVPEINNLELRGSPADNTFDCSFLDSEITFYPSKSLDYPDLSSLINGSTLEILEGDNAGVYSVQSASDVDHKVIVQNHTFITAPVHQISNIYLDTPNYGWGSNIQPFQTGRSFVFIETPNEYHTVTNWIDGLTNDEIYFSPDTSLPIGTGREVKVVSESQQFKFETSYGPYTLNTENSGNCGFVEFDFIFPRGLYKTGSNGKLEENTVDLEIIVETHVNGILQSSVTTPASGTSLEFSPLRGSGYANVNKVNGAIYKVRLRRITPETNDTNASDMLWIRTIKYIEVTPDSSDFGDITLLWVRSKASNGLSAVSQFQINAWVTRSDVSNTIPDAIKDIYTNSDYGAGLPETDLDLIESASEFNGALDTSMTVMDAMKLIARAGRFVTYLDGQKVKIRKDEAQPIRASLFNETNIIKGSLRIDYLFGQHDGFDGMAIKYRDPSDFKEAVSIYPATSTRPEGTELIGCTDHDIAAEAAQYGWQQKQSRKKIVTFSTDDQGLIPNYLDRIAITHNTAQWGLGGQIFSVAGNTIGIRYRFDEDEMVSYNTIIFRKEDGSVSDSYAFTTNNPNEIVLQGTAPTWLYVGDDYDNTFFSFGYTESFIKDYIVTSVKPKGNNAVEIAAVNYDETVYDV